LAGDGHLGDLERRAGDRAVELEVVADGLDAFQDAAQVARDRRFGDL